MLSSNYSVSLQPNINDANLIDMLEKRVEQWPNEMAFTFLRDGESIAQQITFLELSKKVKALAVLLSQQSLEKKTVLLLFTPGIDFIIAYYACIYAGVIGIPAYVPRFNQLVHTIQSIVLDSKATTVLTTSALKMQLGKQKETGEALGKLRLLDIEQGQAFDYKEWKYPVFVNGETIAFLQYTSGSTGMPKGVMVSHHNLLHNTAMLQELFHLEARDRIVSWLPVFHDMGLIANVVLGVQASCHCILMAPLDFLKKPYRWLKAIDHFGAKVSGGPNFSYELCMDRINDEKKESLNLSSWKIAYNGAEPIRASTLRKFTKSFSICGFSEKAWFPCYGMAEGTLIASGSGGDRQPKILSVNKQALESNYVQILELNDPLAQQYVSSGKPVFDQKIVIVDPETEIICSENQVGELWLSGPSVTKGYFQRDEQTQVTFHAHVKTGEGPFYRTGDMGFMYEGEVYITGRHKDMIVIRGANHYPQDIELTIEQSDPIRLRQGCGAAFSIDIDDSEKLVVVQGVAKKIIEPEEMHLIIKNIIRSISAHHGIEVYDVVLVKPGEIPKTTSGKLKRKACRARYLKNDIKRLN